MFSFVFQFSSFLSLTEIHIRIMWEEFVFLFSSFLSLTEIHFRIIWEEPLEQRKGDLLFVICYKE